MSFSVCGMCVRYSLVGMWICVVVVVWVCAEVEVMCGRCGSLSLWSCVLYDGMSVVVDDWVCGVGDMWVIVVVVVCAFCIGGGHWVCGVND